VNEAREQRLLHVGELLERHVLDDRRQLVVITNHNPPLQSIVTVLWVLHKLNTDIIKTINTVKLDKT